METIYHTSPNEIKKIERFGLFDDMLFFSDKEYVMSATKTITYSLDIEEEKILDITRIWYEYAPCDHMIYEYLDNIVNRLGISEEEAANLIDETESVNSEDAEDSFYIQTQQGRIARALGFEAAQATDDQGTVYIVPMLGREADLKRI